MSWQQRDYYREGGNGGGGGTIPGRIAQLLNYSFPIGRYFNIDVRVHIIFVVLVVFELLAISNAWWTLRWTSLLFVSVLLHEFGHCFGCRAVGGRADHILMWPLGGLAFTSPPRRVWAHFVTVACGPLVNIVIAVACYFTLLFWQRMESPPPLDIRQFYSGHEFQGVRGLLRDLYFVNYGLAVFNLLLVFYPFDGGRLVQTILWRFIGYARSATLTAKVGMVGAVGVAIYAIMTQSLMLLFIAVFGFITSYQLSAQMQSMEHFADEPSYDVGTSRKPGWLANWRQKRSQRRRESVLKRAQAEQVEVDRILAKVKEHGLHSLSEKEKRTLQRETDKHRRVG